MQQIIKNYIKRRNQGHQLEIKIRLLEERIYKLKEKQNNKRVSWFDEIIVKLAKTIAKKHNLYYDIYGPFGIQCETSIYWSSKKKIDICKDTTIKITIVPTDLEKGILHYYTGEKTNRFAKGTFGELSGMNNVYALLPNTIEEIIELLQGDRTLLNNGKEQQ